MDYVVLNVPCRDEQESAVYARMFALAKRFVRLLVRDSREHFPGMDIASIPYNRRQGGPGCYGYELVISFFDDIDLSYGQ